MEQITNILYWLSTGLLVPVTIFLLFFFVRALIMIGGFYGTYISRTKVNVKLNKEIETLDIHEFLKNINEHPENKSPLLDYLLRIKKNSGKQVMLEKILGDYEIESDKELSKSKLLVKIGPMLGLMGTLIPMGPALVGLAAGDIASMASNMQVAFATTVVGIIIGATGFIMLLVKQRWVADDMNILEYVVESLKTGKNE
jgi:biopolymer transport protein ExbB/TolQ